MKKILVTTMLGLSLFFGGMLPQQAHAQFAVVETGPNLITNTLNTVEAVAATTKEYVLDTLAWQLANVALEQMTQDIVTWINSGFNGSPAFLQNPERFFSNIADTVAGNFLEEIGGGFLCSPFATDIQFALEIGYYAGSSDLADRYSCTLSDALGNVEDFLDNDLSQGGLDQFFNIAVRPENNPYSVTVDLNQELRGRIFGELEGERQLLDWNGGFLSRRECLAGEQEPNCTGDIVTPGDTIQNQLNDSLGIGRDRLVVADDINEIIGALMNQLVSQALSGAGGLLGLSGSSGGSSSYFDNTRNPNVSNDDQEELTRRINNNIASGNESIQILNDAIVAAGQGDQLLNQALTSASCSAADRDDMTSIASRIALYQVDAVELRTEVENGISELAALLGRLLQDSISRSTYLGILRDYQELVQDNIAPNAATVSRASSLEARIDALVIEGETILSNCGS